MSTANKLTYLNGTKQAIKQAINEDFEVIDNNTTFREYADEISSNNAKYKDLIPKETKNATNTLDISNSAGLDKALVTQYGNTYQEGEPNPDSPQEIQVVTGDNSIEVVGKNLLKLDFVTEKPTFAGLTFTHTDSAFTLKGTTKGTWAIFNLKEKPLIENGATYTFSANITGTNPSMTISCYFWNKSSQQIDNIRMSGNNNYEITKTINFNGPDDLVYSYATFVIENLTNNSAYDLSAEVQLERNNTKTNFEPYSSNSYPINLGDINLCKIGNYKDYIFKNTQDSPHYDNTLIEDAWYLNKQIGKVVLDGSGSLAYQQAQTRFYTSVLDAITENVRHMVYSNYYRYLESGNADGIIFTNGTTLYLYNYSYTSVDELKNWLSTHNTKVYYILETPTNTEITKNNYPTLYNQLNNIKLYEGVNHITMTNESGLDVEFDITYYKDWKLD